MRDPSSTCWGNPSAVKYRGNPSAGGVTSFYRLGRRGGFSEGLATSRRRRVIQGLTSQVGRLQVQGRDTSSRCHLTGARHTTSLTPTRVHCPLCGYPSASSSLPSPIQSVPIPSTRFFFLFDYRLRHSVTAHTLTHLRPGPSDITGFMGSLLDLMRRNWGC